MKLKVFCVALVLVLLLASTPTTAYAGPGTGDCVKGVKAFIDAILDSPNDTESSHGDAISDGFFGNEPNLLNTDTNDDLGPNEVDPGSSAGSVAPSLSPGPWVNNGGFSTWGSAIRGAIPAVCN